jgi:Domain of unknown function (DUF1883)
MNFVHWTFNAQAGNTVVMNIDRQANVFLVDDVNFSAFRRGGTFNYYGALQKYRVVRLTVPRSGQWHLVLQPPAGNTVHYSEPQILAA